MSIIEEFKKVRDIPYRIPLSLEESNDCCSGKSKRLFKLFQKAGYEVRYRICAFRWSDLNLSEELRLVPHDDESTHSYLEVKIGSEWKIVDATWDNGLKDLFTVNDWDGKSDTVVAVLARSVFSPEESMQMMQEGPIASELTLEDLKKNGKFYKAFNEWLEANRKQKV